MDMRITLIGASIIIFIIGALLYTKMQPQRVPQKFILCNQ